MCPDKQCSKCLFNSNVFTRLSPSSFQILQIDAVLPAHPCHRTRRQQLAARPRAQFCQLAMILTQPATKRVATHPSGIRQLIFVHRFHAAKVRKNFELRKQVGNYLPSITINKHQ